MSASSRRTVSADADTWGKESQHPVRFPFLSQLPNQASDLTQTHLSHAIEIRDRFLGATWLSSPGPSSSACDRDV